MYWENDSEHLQDIIPMEEKCPEDLDLINDRLITVLNHSLNADGL